jgi:hypothetical protein
VMWARGGQRGWQETRGVHRPRPRAADAPASTAHLNASSRSSGSKSVRSGDSEAC